MLTIVRGAKLETTTTYIGHVRRELPKIIKEKVSVSHVDWTAFGRRLYQRRSRHVGEGSDRKRHVKEMSTTIGETYSFTDSTATSSDVVLWHRKPKPRTTTIDPSTTGNPFMSPAGRHGNLFYSPQAKTP